LDRELDLQQLIACTPINVAELAVTVVKRERIRCEWRLFTDQRRRGSQVGLRATPA
jgi:hypothetical protein